jgi:hypothetical protein
VRPVRAVNVATIKQQQWNFLHRLAHARINNRGVFKVASDLETLRLKELRTAGVLWRKWGPYLSERQWGTVREDYSRDGDAWNYFTHDQARSRAYRWGEDVWQGSATTNNCYVSP